jgi:hypothetical protein
LTHDPELFFITRLHQAHLVHHIRFENRGALTTIPARQIIGGMGEEFIFILFFVTAHPAFSALPLPPYGGAKREGRGAEFLEVQNEIMISFCTSIPSERRKMVTQLSSNY